MSLLDDIRADMAWYLTQWPESLLRRRSSLSYDDGGLAVESWSSSLSFTGDFQTLGGSEVEAESGLEHHSEYQIETEYDADVDQHDRVERDGETFRVNSVQGYEDHKVIRVYREIVQP
jgi:hypothetical protein